MIIFVFKKLLVNNAILKSAKVGFSDLVKHS